MPQRPIECNPVDTPRTVKSLNAHDQPLEVIRSRQAVAMQGKVAEVDIEKFVDYYLPFHPDNDVVDTAVECLVESGNLRKQQDGEVWTKFDGVEDSDEDARFNRLIPIFEVLQGLKVGHRERTCGFRRDPNRTTASEISGSAHKVDGYLGLMKSTMPVSSLPVSKEVPTADVAVNCEFKLDPKKRPDNRRKVLYSAGHAMNNDPCRRFMYSVTIESSDTQLWYWSRSHSAMSTLFDFTANPRLFISIMIAFLFATPQELGYDDDIKRVWDDTGIQYVYHIDDLYLKTVRCLDEPFGLCITGRATRVWEAKKVKSFVDLTPIEQSTVVVRDVWLDVSTKTERQIQQEIFSALDDLYKDGDPPDDDPKFDGEEDAKRRELIDCVKDGSFRSYFLTILADKEGELVRGAPEDAAVATVAFGPVPYVSRGASASGSHSPRTFRHQPGSSSRHTMPVKPSRCPRRSYRLVYEEVCTSLNDVDNFREAVNTLTDGVFALQLLFLAGWIHCDISSGNLLRYSTNGQGPRCRLGDLEYAKAFKMDDRSSSGLKTGTPQFMALEIHMGRTLFHQPPLPTPSDKRRHRKRQFFEPPDAVEDVMPPEVRHNYEHDLESIFWLLLWFVTCRSDHWNAQAYGKDVFQHDMHPSRQRQDIFLQPRTGDHALRTHLTTKQKPVVEAIIDFRSALRNAYIYRKHELTEDYTYSYLYNAARECLEQCRVHNTTVEVLPLPRPKLGVPSKRSGRCKRRQAPPADDADYEPPLKRIQVSDSQSSIGSSPDDGE